jgi:pimeloyl-ACP methyl ester carboxylesterase
MSSLIIISGAPWAIPLFRKDGYATLTTEARAERILAMVDLLETHEAFCDYAVGCFGSGAGAGAALDATAQRPWGIGALVAVDASSGAFERVRVPTLLQLRRENPVVLQFARRAYANLPEYCDVAAPRDDAEAVHLACAWFARHLGAAQREPTYPVQ